MPRFTIPLLVVLAGCAAPGLDDLRASAEITHDARVTGLRGTALTVETETRSPGGETLVWRGSVRHGQEMTRTETWKQDVHWDEGYVQLTDGVATQLWEVGGTGAIHLPVLGAPHGQQLLNWSASTAIQAGGALSRTADIVQERPCHRITVATDRHEGRPCYLLQPGEASPWLDGVLAEETLALIAVELQTDGQLRVLDRAAFLAQPEPAAATVTRIWATERGGQLGQPLGDAAWWAPGDPCPWISNVVDVITDLWLDPQTLLPVQLQGWVRIPGAEAQAEVRVVWSDVQPVADGVPYPHQLDYYLDDQLLVTSKVVAIEPDREELRTYVPHAHADLEHLVQTNHAKRLLALAENPQKDHGGWAEGKDEQFQPARVVELLDLERGDVVGDVGAGSGYFTFKLARAVGPQGRVLAIDVNPYALASMDDKVADPSFNPHGNVERHLDRPDDVDLPDGTLDAILVCDVGFVRFRNLSQPSQAMLRSLHAAAREGARLISIEKLGLGFEDAVLALGPATVVFPLAAPETSRGGLDPYIEPDGDVLTTNYRRAGFEPVEHHAFVDLYDLWVYERK